MVPENEIAEGFGWILAAMTVGASLGQLLSGLLTERCGPQMAFTGIALLGIGVAGWVMLRRSTLEAGAQDRKIIA
jgi:MFS family permease